MDHFVLPVASLDALADNMKHLGFTIAPEGRHPFGTSNHCIFLKSGQYLEYLAITHRKNYDAAGQFNNTFIKLDQNWRMQNGETGFSALAFASDDAVWDQSDFIRQGMQSQPLLDFSRPFIGGDGVEDMASFRLAFATIPNNHDVFFFTCQRVGVLNVDQTALKQHANGTNKLLTVYMCAENLAQNIELMQSICHCEPSLIEEHLLCFQLPNAEIRILSPKALSKLTGRDYNGLKTLSLQGIGFGVDELHMTKSYFQDKKIYYKDLQNKILLFADYEKSPFFVFEESYERTK